MDDYGHAIVTGKPYDDGFNPYNKGDLIMGHYEVIGDKPKKGGKGIVYKVKNKDSGYIYAAKTINPVLFGRDQASLDSFLKEIITLIDLPDHSNIVGIDFIKKDKNGLPFIFMEYIEGASLREKLKKEHKRRIGKKEALNIAYQICVGMEHIHENGKILHLDLKPENILLDQEGKVKICDFGLAKPSFSLTGESKEFLATSSICYESPEIVNKQEVDTWSDVYSFGIIFYELLMGKHPYPFDTLNYLKDGGNPAALKKLRNLLKTFHKGNDDFHDEFSHRAIIPEFTAEMGSILGHCLAKIPHKRLNGFTYLKRWLKMEYEEFLEIEEIKASKPDLYRKALNLQEIEEHSRAVGLFNTVLIDKPNDPNIWLAAAASYRALGDVKLAEKLEKKAGKLLSSQ